MHTQKQTHSIYLSPSPCFSVHTNSSTPEVQCLCSRSVCVCVFVYLFLLMYVCECICVWWQKQSFRGLWGLLLNRGDKASDCRLQSHGLVCVWASIVSLSRVRCVYACVSLRVRVCLCAGVHMSMCDSMGVQERALACISPASARLLSTHTHEHTEIESEGPHC